MADGPNLKKRKLEDPVDPPKEGKMNVVLALCGSFNPPTLQHLRLFELARTWLHQQGKYIVTGGLMSPVHIAYGKKGLLSNEHRLAMSRLATQDSDWIRVSDWECSQDGWTVTEKALTALQKEVSATSDSKLLLLCGGDLLESFATPELWDPQDIRSIISNFGMVVSSRAGSDPEKFIYESDELNSLKQHIHLITEWIPNEVSSTKIRRSLKRGESVKYLIPDAVLEYIKQHNLYTDI